MFSRSTVLIVAEKRSIACIVVVADVSPRTVQTGQVNQVRRQLGLAEALLIAYASTFV